jgi:hypothetical protein
MRLASNTTVKALPRTEEAAEKLNFVKETAFRPYVHM